MDSQMTVEHRSLIGAAEQLLNHIRTFRERMRPSGVDYEQHHAFEEEATTLGLTLRAALELASAHLYPAAFAVLRSALEQQALDHLYLLANRYEETIPAVNDEMLASWQAKLAAGELGPDIVSIERVGGVGSRRAAMVRTGIHFQGQGAGPDAPTLSPLYLVLDEYDPIAGRADVQEWLVGDYVGSIEDRVARARGHFNLWRENLRWPALRKNLALNGFYGERELTRWDVHHGFLSAFVHYTPRARYAVWGRNRPTHAPHYDHYCSELILLYVITLSRLELEALGQMANRPPAVELTNWDQIRSDLDMADDLASHLWFPRGVPHAFDRVEEANRHGMRDGTFVPTSERTRPEDLRDEDVRYYENPLRRLVNLHRHIDELTGFPYISPWPREDATIRSLFG